MYHETTITVYSSHIRHVNIRDLAKLPLLRLASVQMFGRVLLLLFQFHWDSQSYTIYHSSCPLMPILYFLFQSQLEFGSKAWQEKQLAEAAEGLRQCSGDGQRAIQEMALHSLEEYTGALPWDE